MYDHVNGKSYNSTIGDVDERLYDLLEKAPRFFLGDTFRNTFSKCLLFDELLRHNQKVYMSHAGKQTI